MDWQFLDREILIALQERQLAVYGGASGLRDENMLMSALARPQNILAYEPDADAARLAAAYAFGVARNHPFVDGNKRAALVAMEVFLDEHGYQLNASNEECVIVILRLAAGDLSEADLVDWLRANLAPLEA